MMSLALRKENVSFQTFIFGLPEQRMIYLWYFYLGIFKFWNLLILSKEFFTHFAFERSHLQVRVLCFSFLLFMLLTLHFKASQPQPKENWPFIICVTLKVFKDFPYAHWKHTIQLQISNLCHHQDEHHCMLCGHIFPHSMSLITSIPDSSTNMTYVTFSPCYKHLLSLIQN